MRIKDIEDTDGPKRAIPLNNYLNGQVLYDTLHAKADRPMSCTNARCSGSLITQWKVENEHASYCSLDVFKKAEDFLREFYKQSNREDEFLPRWEEVLCQLTETGTYEMNTNELDYAVKMAWRNATRCSARIQWNKLKLLDHRNDVHDTDDMFAAICDHIKYTTNGGNLRPAITLFRQRRYGEEDLRVWNSMMVAYAGYEIEEEVPDPDGIGTKKVKTLIGDQGNLEFTQFCQRLGWKGKGTRFDFLPVVLSDRGVPKFYEIPEELIIRIPITHPTLTAIGELNLEWYALPYVAGMMFEVGGLQFPAAPFAGWYTSIEIATRDLLEPTRYNLLEDIGLALGYDTSNNATLWKDRVALEMNAAVLHSFKLANATIVDQHTVSESFQTHLEEEYRVRGGCPSDWVWLTPSQSGSLVPLYHQEMLHYHLSPSYERQDALWKKYRFPEDGEKRTFKVKSIGFAVRFAVGLFRAKMSRRPQVKIFYATETGVSKRYAERLKKIFLQSFNVSVFPMDQYDSYEAGSLSGLCLFVTSTFGNGDPPKMAQSLSAWLEEKLTHRDVMVSRRVTFSPFKEEIQFFNHESNGYDNPEESTDSVLSVDSELNDEELVTKSIDRQNRRTIRKMSTVIGVELGDLKFGVFALGSTAYPHFCGFGKWLDTALSRLDGNRLLQVGLGDELGDRDGEFRRWSRLAFQKACVESGIEIKEAKSGESGSSQVDRVASRWKIISIEGEKDRGIVQTAKDLSAHHGHKVLPSILTNRRVLPAETTKEILIHLEIGPNPETGEPAPYYEPGDHLAVFAVNSDKDVDFVLKHLTGLPKDPKRSIVQLQENQGGSNWDPVSSGLPKSTVCDLFKHHLSLRTTPSMETLEFFAGRAGRPAEKAKLLRLGTDFQAYDEWRSQEPSIVDLFRQFPSLRVDSAELAFRLPSLQPRFYSIASCPTYRLGLNTEVLDMKRGTTYLDLLLTVVRYQTPGPRSVEKKGFCSNFLYETPIGTSVACYLRSAPDFHLPDNHSDVPLVLIGAGSGLAPFRGFWQHLTQDSLCADRGGVIDKVTFYEAVQMKKREQDPNHSDIDSPLLARKARYAKIQLYYGCRDESADLLRDETDPLNDILTRHTAYSRLEGHPKEYVQDLVRRDVRTILHALIKNKKGRVYVCGKVSMAEAVNKALVEVIAKAGKIDLEKANLLVNRMKEEGRYVQDIFGQ